MAMLNGQEYDVAADLATLRDWIGDPEDYSDEDRGAAERACDAVDGVEAELARVTQERDAQKYRADQHVQKWVESDAAKSEERAEAAEQQVSRLTQVDMQRQLADTREALEQIEKLARQAIREGFLHQHEWVKVLNLAAGLSATAPETQPAAQEEA